MRNIFDQYDSQENRLTHALACCLSEDGQLLRRFIHWATGQRLKSTVELQVLEQQVPGQPQSDAEDNEGRGLPDMWIHDGDDWSLIAESKVAAPVETDQLRRHLATARRNGFDKATLLVLAPDLPRHKMSGVLYKTWAEVYSWMRRQRGKSEWAARFTEYIEIAEVRMTADGYLGDKVLTRFDGIPFDTDHPYSYREAKRLLRLLMSEVRKRKELEKVGIDPGSKGRPAITGRDAISVWDFLRFTSPAGNGNFTAHPHATVSIQATRLLTTVILPDACAAKYRRNLTNGGLDKFCELVGKVEDRVTRVVPKTDLAFPLMLVEQRHYLSRKTRPITDARLEFDLRTARRGDQLSVKCQMQWLTAAYEALAKKKSNLQVVIAAAFPYGSDVLKSRKVIDLVVNSWVACKPWIDQLMRSE